MVARDLVNIFSHAPDVAGLGFDRHGRGVLRQRQPFGAVKMSGGEAVKRRIHILRGKVFAAEM